MICCRSAAFCCRFVAVTRRFSVVPRCFAVVPRCLGTDHVYFKFRSQRFPALLLRLGTDMGFFRFRSQRFPALLMRLGTEAFLSEKSSTFLISFCRLFLEISCVYPILLSCLQIYGEQFVKIQLLYPNDLKSCGSNFEKNSFCTQTNLYVVLT